MEGQTQNSIVVMFSLCGTIIPYEIKNRNKFSAYKLFKIYKEAVKELESKLEE